MRSSIELARDVADDVSLHDSCEICGLDRVMNFLRFAACGERNGVNLYRFKPDQAKKKLKIRKSQKGPKLTGIDGNGLIWSCELRSSLLEPSFDTLPSLLRPFVIESCN